MAKIGFTRYSFFSTLEYKNRLDENAVKYKLNLKWANEANVFISNMQRKCITEIHTLSRINTETRLVDFHEI